MRSAESRLDGTRTLLLAGFVALLTACGGGTTTTSTTICKDPSICATDLAEQSMPTGPNTTEIVVDSGPLGAFVLGVTNVPYVTVTVCSPNMTTNNGCVTIDHVLLDTGSYGLRLLKSKLGAVAPLLPAVPIAADASNNTPAGDAAECYPFVIGTIWGPLAKADIHVGGELAYAQTIQVIDDGQPQSPPVPQNCLDAAQGSLLTSVSTLQANGILGVGMVQSIAASTCLDNTYASWDYVYYSCPPGGALHAGRPCRFDASTKSGGWFRGQQQRHDDHDAGPAQAGCQSRQGSACIRHRDPGQQPAAGDFAHVPCRDEFGESQLPVRYVQVGGQSYPQSYIDTGSNAMFFDSTDPALVGSAM